MEKFNLKWNYTNKLVNDLLKINRAKEVVDLLELPVSIEEEIKKETIVKRVHYSTKIEGNKLKLKEVKEVIENNKESHERNVLEVRNYFENGYEVYVLQDYCMAHKGKVLHDIMIQNLKRLIGKEYII